MNNRLEIKSYVGVGPIVFGMTAKEVRSALGCTYEEFKRDPMSPIITDAFDSLGVFVCYNVDKKCNAIEMAAPAQPFFAGRDLLNNSFGNVFEYLRGFDRGVNLRIDGLTSFALGIGLYAPDCVKDRPSPAESVIAFERGYYENDEK